MRGEGRGERGEDRASEARSCWQQLTLSLSSERMSGSSVFSQSRMEWSCDPVTCNMRDTHEMCSVMGCVVPPHQRVSVMADG